MTSGSKARAERQAKIDAAAPQESKTRLILGVVIALVAVLGIGAVILNATRGSTSPTQVSATSRVPAGVTGAFGGIVVNADKAKPNAPRLDVYEDFQCPACKTVEAQLGPTIKELASSGQVVLIYHIKTFLDDNLRNDSSTRAGIAASCAADAGKFQAYHDAVYAGQPAQEGVGYTDAQLASFAGTAGITGSALETWKSCVKDKRYATYLTTVETESAKDGVRSTPTFRVNGTTIDLAKVTGVEAFKALVLAGGQAPAPATSSAP